MRIPLDGWGERIGVERWNEDWDFDSIVGHIQKYDWEHCHLSHGFEPLFNLDNQESRYVKTNSMGRVDLDRHTQGVGCYRI